MTDKFPKPVSAPSVPAAFDGEIYKAVGKYARSAVLFAFEEMGGARGLAEWGQKNEDEFYTKLFPKIIARESEVKQTLTIDQLSEVIDADYEVEDAVFDHTPNGQALQHEPVANNWNTTSYDVENEDILYAAAQDDDLYDEAYSGVDLVEVNE
jgi:hypothetical protein